MKSRRRSLKLCILSTTADCFLGFASEESKAGTDPAVKAGMPVIDQIQPAILKRTAVRFDLSESERVERASVLGADS